MITIEPQKIYKARINAYRDMAETYRLQYFDDRDGVLAINWAKDRKNYVPGDCRVRAIHGDTDLAEHNRVHFQNQNYSAPLTLEEARLYISQNTGLLGEVHDCVGLALEDICGVADFSEPIQIRNLRQR